MKWITKDQIDQIFNVIDADGQGSVDYDEFIVTCANPKVVKTPKAIEAMFIYLGPNE